MAFEFQISMLLQEQAVLAGAANSNSNGCQQALSKQPKAEPAQLGSKEEGRTMAVTYMILVWQSFPIEAGNNGLVW